MEKAIQTDEKINEARDILAKEGKELAGWIKGNIKFVRSERTFLKDVLLFGIQSSSTAKRLLTIYHKAQSIGYPEKDESLYKDSVTNKIEFREKQIECFYNEMKIKDSSITKEAARHQMSELYREMYGISFDDTCPICKGELCLVENKRFQPELFYIGCSNYPDCNFFANSTYRYLSGDERKEYEELVKKVHDIPIMVWLSLSEWLESQRKIDKSKRLKNWYRYSILIYDITIRASQGTPLTYKQATLMLGIYESAVAHGFHFVEECTSK